jgi:hypothetical protein
MFAQHPKTVPPRLASSQNATRRIFWNTWLTIQGTGGRFSDSSGRAQDLGPTRVYEPAFPFPLATILVWVYIMGCFSSQFNRGPSMLENTGRVAAGRERAWEASPEGKGVRDRSSARARITKLEGQLEEAEKREGQARENHTQVVRANRLSEEQAFNELTNAREEVDKINFELARARQDLTNHLS